MRSARRQTAWLAALLLAVGLSAWLMDDAGPGHAHDDDELRGRRLFPGEPLRLRIEAHGLGCRYRHDGKWRGSCGKQELALDVDAAEQLAMVPRMRAEREWPVGSDSHDELGLQEPLLILEAETTAGPVVLHFGVLAPDGLSRYVHWPEKGLAVTVPDFHFRNLLALLKQEPPKRSP